MCFVRDGNDPAPSAHGSAAENVVHVEFFDRHGHLVFDGFTSKGECGGKGVESVLRQASWVPAPPVVKWLILATTKVNFVSSSSPEDEKQVVQILAAESAYYGGSWLIGPVAYIKYIYISPFLLTIFGPVNYGPPL